MIKYITASLLLLLSSSSCVNSDAAKRTLLKAGYTDVRITGYSPFQCGENDFSSTGFTAKNAQGAQISGTVCCGLITKACTIRY